MKVSCRICRAVKIALGEVIQTGQNPGSGAGCIPLVFPDLFGGSKIPRCGKRQSQRNQSVYVSLGGSLLRRET